MLPGPLSDKRPADLQRFAEADANLPQRSKGAGVKGYVV